MFFIITITEHVRHGYTKHGFLFPGHISGESLLRLFKMQRGRLEIESELLGCLLVLVNVTLWCLVTDDVESFALCFITAVGIVAFPSFSELSWSWQLDNRPVSFPGLMA